MKNEFKSFVLHPLSFEAQRAKKCTLSFEAQRAKKCTLSFEAQRAKKCPLSFVSCPLSLVLNLNPSFL